MVAADQSADAGRLETSKVLVGIVIVSHSAEIAHGTAEMVRQTVGDHVALAWTGGDPDGGLGTDPAKIMAAIREVLGAAGVAVFVDLGGAETNAEVAIEMLGEEAVHRVIVCDAPIVEGAIMGAAAAANGVDLAEVCRTAEEQSL